MMEVILLDLMILIVVIVLAPLPNELEALEHNREASWQETVKTLELGD